MTQNNDYALLNIGLNVRGLDMVSEEKLTVTDVVNAIADKNVKIKQIAVVQSDTERTAVVAIEPPLTRAALHSLAVRLNQEAIAQWNSSQSYRTGGHLRLVDMQRAGMLAGPKAEVWGEFDPARFFGFTGRPITSILALHGEEVQHGHLTPAGSCCRTQGPYRGPQSR